MALVAAAVVALLTLPTEVLEAVLEGGSFGGGGGGSIDACR